MARFDGKRALITGGTSGIGAATAKLLLAEGARVLVTGTSDESVRAAQGELPGAVAVRSDAADVADIDRLAARVAEELGGIDLLFLNAGVPQSIPLDGVTEADFDRAFAVNARGPFFAVQKLAPLMPAGSSIVVTTSVSNVKGLATQAVYGASKAALRSLTRTLARELLRRGIRVNAVSPGPTDTPIIDKTLAPDEAAQLREQLARGNPMRRMASVDEVARAVLFLGFEATFTTGAELPVDGGVSQL